MATVRALKMHGGGPQVKPGRPLDEAYTKENLGLLEKGCENLVAHIETVKKSGVRPIVCVNAFHTDSKAERELVRKIAEQTIRYAKLEKLEKDPTVQKLGTCMVKTHLSLSHDPERKGRPRGWQLPIRDFLVYKGAGFVVPVSGDIKLMPGTASRPAFRKVDVDTGTGRVRGLF